MGKVVVVIRLVKGSTEVILPFDIDAAVRFKSGSEPFKSETWG